MTASAESRRRMARRPSSTFSEPGAALHPVYWRAIGTIRQLPQHEPRGSSRVLQPTSVSSILAPMRPDELFVAASAEVRRAGQK
jgi:hypothetical protein